MRKLIAALMICGAFVTGYAQEDAEAEVSMEATVEVASEVSAEISSAANEVEVTE
jgi:hypothetical protein